MHTVYMYAYVAIWLWPQQEEASFLPTTVVLPTGVVAVGSCPHSVAAVLTSDYWHTDHNPRTPHVPRTEYRSVGRSTVHPCSCSVSGGTHKTLSYKGVIATSTLVARSQCSIIGRGCLIHGSRCSKVSDRTEASVPRRGLAQRLAVETMPQFRERGAAAAQRGRARGRARAGKDSAHGGKACTAVPLRRDRNEVGDRAEQEKAVESDPFDEYSHGSSSQSSGGG